MKPGQGLPSACAPDKYGNWYEGAYFIDIINVENEALGFSSADADGLSIYPNPFHRSATIYFPNHSGQHYKLTVSDLSGKVCPAEDQIVSNKYILDRNNFRPGVYIIQLSGDKIYRGKIIIE